MNKMVVMAKAAPGRVEELARWYDEVHLNQLVAVPGIAAVERHTIMPIKRPEGSPEWDFMMIYEFEGDAMTALGNMSKVSFDWSDALESTSTLSTVGISCGRRTEPKT